MLVKIINNVAEKIKFKFRGAQNQEFVLLHVLHQRTWRVLRNHTAQPQPRGVIGDQYDLLV